MQDTFFRCFSFQEEPLVEMDLVYVVITIVCGNIIHLSELRQLQVVTVVVFAMSRGVYEVDVCLLCILFYTWRALQLLTLDDLKGRPRKSLKGRGQRERWWNLFILAFREALVRFVYTK